MGRPRKFTSTVDTALLAQVDTSYGWNDQQFRALDLGLFALCCLLYLCYTFVIHFYLNFIKELSFHQKKESAISAMLEKM